MCFFMGDQLTLELLKQIYKFQLINEDDFPSQIFYSNYKNRCIDDCIQSMILNKLIYEIKPGLLRLTEVGRSKLKVIFTGGVYDLLHVGHLNTLHEAANLGNFLVVVIARDKTVEQKKRLPIHSEVDRLLLIKSLNMVDLAVLGDEEDHYKVVRKINPDIIAIGADQEHAIKKIEGKLQLHDLDHIKVVRLIADVDEKSTTNLINVILAHHES